MNNTTLTTYGARLKYAIAQRGMNQTELATKLKLKPQTIQRLCAKGKRSVFTSKIAKALQINDVWLDDGTGNMGLPVQNEFLDKMSALTEKDRNLITQLVDKLASFKYCELMNKFNELSDRDRKIIEQTVDNFLGNNK